MVNSNPPVNTLPPDQISPKAVIMRVIQIKNAVLRNWKLIIIFMVIGGIGGFILDYFTKKKTIYTAVLTFNLGGGSSGSSSFGELGALAGAFGLAGGAPDANIFTGDNFLVYSRSRPVIEKTLLKEVTVNGKKNLLVNYYIEKGGIREDEWEDDDTLRNIRFTKKPIAKFTLLENIAMGQIFERIKGETTLYQPDRKSSFIELRVGMEQEFLAKVFAENLLTTIEEDYKVKQTKKTREMYDVLSHRADSLARLLNRTESNLARYIDQNQQMVVAEGQIQQTRLSRNSTFLQSQYLGALQQVDNLRLSLIKEAPLFTVIEPVSLPLVKDVTDPRGTEAGIILGLILGVVVIFFRETFRSIMNEA
ncbi:hypothetical protein [Tellurirhabdus bombi]|uniref:hypothetical protein n=1 Tax=Tellurirhabdus bombi TaxID=2907205 RepID=UPI001F174024|nr:hypothetical protein [Tellurirhabdus bombi]